MQRLKAIIDRAARLDGYWSIGEWVQWLFARIWPWVVAMMAGSITAVEAWIMDAPLWLVILVTMASCGIVAACGLWAQAKSNARATDYVQEAGVAKNESTPAIPSAKEAPPNAEPTAPPDSRLSALPGVSQTESAVPGRDYITLIQAITFLIERVEEYPGQARELLSDPERSFWFGLVVLAGEKQITIYHQPPHSMDGPRPVPPEAFKQTPDAEDWIAGTFTSWRGAEFHGVSVRQDDLDQILTVFRKEVSPL